MDDSSRSEPAASQRMSMPFCSVMVSGGAKVKEEDRKLRVPGGGGGTGKWMNVVVPRCQMVMRTG